MGASRARLQVSQFGRVRNWTGNTYTPEGRDSGYKRLCVKKVRLYLHRLVHVLFNDPDLEGWKPGATVDHVDRNPSNCNAFNLRWASKAQQRHNQRPRLQVQTTRIRATFANGEQRVYASQFECSKLLGIQNSGISRCIAGEYAQTKGVRFENIIDDDLPGEEWRAVGKFRVSNKGRVGAADEGWKEFPKIGDDGYARYGVKPFGGVVLEAFGFAAPSETHTVDHMDRNPSNNALDNLRWATQSQQRDNQGSRSGCGVRRLKARRAGSSDEWQFFANSSFATKATGCSIASIVKAANPKSRSKTAGGYGGVRYEFESLGGEDDMDGEVWKTVVAEEWLEGGKYGGI